MELDFLFFFNSILLGCGLAMDAFSVSLANGLNEPHMNKRKLFVIPSVFSFFQFIMPLIGWVLVKTIVTYFHVIERFIPWIAFIFLSFIGGKMIYDSLRAKHETEKTTKLGCLTLFMQGIATSIDALSVGFTISDYDVFTALISSLIISAVTFGLCLVGIMIGKTAGTKLTGKASMLGGLILVFIGIEILIKSLL